MSSTKRKRSMPQQLSEEKRSKMTWSMRDQMSDNQDDYLWEPLDGKTGSVTSVCRDRTCRPLKKGKKKENQGCVELNLDNSYPTKWHCTLGSFNIFLSTSKSHVQSLGERVDMVACSSVSSEISTTCGTNGEILVSSDSSASEPCSSATEDSTDVVDVVVTLNLETQCSLESMDFDNLNYVKERDYLKGLKLKAFVPCVTKEQLNALVYLQSKGIISLVLSPEQPVLTDCWLVAVCLNECGLTKLSFPSVEMRMRKADKMITVVMTWLFSSFKEYSQSQELEVPVVRVDKGFDDVYDAIKTIQENSCPSAMQVPVTNLSPSPGENSLYTDKGDDFISKVPSSCSTTELCSSDGIKELDDVQHPRLKPALRSYQKRAVRWMMNREKHQNSIPQEQEYSGKLNNSIHPLWKEVYTLDGQVIYCNPYTGRLTRERFSSPALPRGGILADEMGLGKTVEVIACILNHPKPSSDFYTADEHSTVNSSTATEYNQKLISCCGKQSTCKSSVEVTGSIQECATSEPNMCEQGRTIKCICQSTCTPKNEADVIDMEVIAGQTSPVGEAPLKSSHTLPDVSISNDKERATQMVSDLLHSRTADHAGESHSRTSDHTGESYSRTSDLTGESHSRTPDHTGESHSRTSDLTSESHASEEGNASSVLKCQCICGSNDTNLSDSLLRCCSCQAVFHAKCLQHESTEEFVCPHCIVNRPAVSSRATLIISPAPIAQQWVEEISRHTETSALRLLVYEGVAKMGFIQPAVLAHHDVILTTYSTLRADFYHLGAKQADGAGRSLRYDKRYVALPSPLTAVFFWRICLDEAQMVESATAKAAEVALHLKCEHRWCVTGTPLQRGLEDIYGLLLFLGVYPYCQRSWWKTLLYEPYKNGRRQPLYNLLARIMWRSAKNDVINEIQLPKQEEKVKWLTFSPVEHHFYCRQHEECARTTLKMLSHWEKSDTKLSTIDRHTVHQMVTPLLRLRQACCHPQAVRGGFLSMQKSTLTMEQLLESLTTKAKLECEEAHRQLLFAFNGLAGIHIIKEEWPNAVDLYREAMRSWTEHQHTFRTDALQKLHTLCNLSAVLSNAYPGCSRTLRDDNLQNEVKDMKQVYMTRVNTQVAVAQQNLDVVKTSITETLQKVDLQSPWWMSALQSVLKGSMDGDLLQRVKDELSSTEMDLASFGQRFSDVRGLQYLISSKLDTIMSTHDNLLVSLEELNVEPSSQMVQVSAECCLRPAKDHSHATRCKFCEVDDIFTEYESRLFGHQGMKGVTEQDMQPDERLDWHRHGNTGGLRAESEVEKVLKVLFNFIKAQKIIPSVHQEARYHLNMIEALRKEFKFLRALWFALHERVSSLDELDMCTTRLRLLLPGEPLTDDNHVIHPLQVEQQHLKFMSDRVVAQTELRKKLGQLLYLNNLAKTQTCRDGKNPDPCPVCTKQLGVQWSVFSCGHCICCQCAWVLLRQAGIGPRQRDVQVKCPMCRLPTVAREISYVSTARNQTDKPEDNVVVKGSHSTKVEAVVRTVLSIRMSDSTAKCLVFSTWQDVLGVVGRALDENGINYRHIAGSRHFQTNLQTFKQDPDVCVLLLPLHSGSNGLNIIEATHVLLVEPALNPAHELQAVGRVHRIGQTKPTHVYRFIIRGTVESRMFALLQSKPTTCVRPGAHDNENASLTVGDLAALFTADCEEEEQCTGSFHLQEEPEQLHSR